MSIQTELEARNVKLQGILDDTNAAITAKGGTQAATLRDLPEAVGALPEGGGGGTKNLISEVLSLTPYFDESWTTARFTLTSAQSGTGFTVPNPLGKVPQEIFVLKLDIDWTVNPQVIGGYNIGNISADNNNNRTIALNESHIAPTAPKKFLSGVNATNWNIQSTAHGISTAEEIRIRSGDRAGITLWLAGEYILGVK